MIYFACRKSDFLPAPAPDVRWLDKDADFELAQSYWAYLGQVLKRSTWEKAHEYGYSYSGIIEDGRIISTAAVWRFSDKNWEVAAISTREEHRQRGYARQVISFVASFILEAGRLATCSTSDANSAMIAAAQCVGFRIIPVDQVWWSYPDLPDF